MYVATTHIRSYTQQNILSIGRVNYYVRRCPHCNYILKLLTTDVHVDEYYGYV